MLFQVVIIIVVSVLFWNVRNIPNPLHNIFVLGISGILLIIFSLIEIFLNRTNIQKKLFQINFSSINTLAKSHKTKFCISLSVYFIMVRYIGYYLSSFLFLFLTPFWLKDSNNSLSIPFWLFLTAAILCTLYFLFSIILNVYI